VLRAHCATEGRDESTITKTMLAVQNPLDDTAAFVAEMAEYARLGIQTVGLMPVGDPVAFTRRVGRELVPALAQLGD
jgi:hypothetical protein